MKNVFCRALYTLVQWTWGLPQNIAGAIVYLFLLVKDPKREKTYFHGSAAIKWNRFSSGGVGMFIFCGKNTDIRLSPVMAHEFGHTIQSAILGPFYLLIIGLPSVCWAFIPYFVNKRKRQKRSYYSFYTESWANRSVLRTLGLKTPE